LGDYCLQGFLFGGATQCRMKASLMDYSARWYSPSTGRFTSEDTFLGWIDEPLSLNSYSYVHNNPVNYIDPTGHAADAGGGGGGGNYFVRNIGLYIDDVRSGSVELWSNGTTYFSNGTPVRSYYQNLGYTVSWSSSKGVLVYTPNYGSGGSSSGDDNSSGGSSGDSSSGGSSGLTLEQRIQEADRNLNNVAGEMPGFGNSSGISYLSDSYFDVLSFEDDYLANGNRYKTTIENGRTIIVEYNNAGNIIDRWMLAAQVGTNARGEIGDQIYYKLSKNTIANTPFYKKVSYEYFLPMNGATGNELDKSDFMYYDASEEEFISIEGWKNLHYNERYQLNNDSSLPKTPEEALEHGFTKMVPPGASYHDGFDPGFSWEIPGFGNEGNWKYIHPDGREAIYTNDGKLITLNENSDIGPTYNYVPSEFNDYLNSSYYVHYFFDMVPFYWWGNTE